MSWQRRLQELILAGGAFALAGCSTENLKTSGRDASGSDTGSDVYNPGTFCGNANSDPCICGRPEASAAAADQCAQSRVCQSQGGYWDPYGSTTEGGTLGTKCELPDGSAVDAGSASDSRVGTGG
jgi:hypothetical protein